MMNSNIAAAKALVDARVCQNTKSNYISKWHRMRNYLLSSNVEGALFDDTEENLIQPLSTNALESLFGWLSTNTALPKGVPSNIDEAAVIDDEIEAEFAENSITVSVSCMQGYQSALKWYYEERRLSFDLEQQNTLKKLMQGYKKKVADKKERGVMDTKEGRSGLTFYGYKSIATRFLTTKHIGNQHSPTEGIFGWAFLVLSWNLMCRSISCGSIMLQHLDWFNDHMNITFAKTKCDQCGEGTANTKAVFANPLDPMVCPILALAVFVVGTHRPHKELSQIFGEIRAEDRFSKLLRKTLHCFAQEGINIGSTLNDIGTHSNRKGSISYVLQLCGVAAHQVYLRAGWSLGNTQNRYIVAGAGGDEMVGRAVTGLPITSKQFSILPPHFTEADKMEIDRNVQWDQIIDGNNFSRFSMK